MTMERVVHAHPRRLQARPDHQLRRAGQPLHRPHHGHELLGPGLRGPKRDAQAGHRRTRRRLLHPGRAALHQPRPCVWPWPGWITPTSASPTTTPSASARTPAPPPISRSCADNCRTSTSTRRPTTPRMMSARGYCRANKLVRQRQVYYDTDGINEVQQETPVPVRPLPGAAQDRDQGRLRPPVPGRGNPHQRLPRLQEPTATRSWRTRSSRATTATSSSSTGLTGNTCGSGSDRFSLNIGPFPTARNTQRFSSLHPWL